MYRIGGYVRSLQTPEGAERVIAATRAAIGERRADEPRCALLVWLVKQDHVLHRIAFAVLFPNARRSDRRALRWSPDVHAGSDREATLRAHRVLAALLVQPGPGLGSPGQAGSGPDAVSAALNRSGSR